ncbi:MAG: hypothetical protein RQ842_08495 [Vulcanisaeta sp.]|jgi:hypothetical protein|nr:hypothetical protein [Vulcanisaeta sp.]
MNKVECSDNVWRVYERLVEDWRRYDAMLWQIPFGTMAAVGAILTLAFHYIPSSEHVIRAALFIALAWFTLVMMHLSYKIRHFQIERSACIEAIECKCAKFTIPYDTKGARKLVLYKEVKKGEHEFYRVRSYHLIYAMYIGIIAILLYLALIESLYIAIIGIGTIILFIIVIFIGYIRNFINYVINYTKSRRKSLFIFILLATYFSEEEKKKRR